MPNVNTIPQGPRGKRSVLFLTVTLRTLTSVFAKNKSHPISRDEQKKYQPGNCRWEIVPGIEKSDSYSFPILRSMNQESLGTFYLFLLKLLWFQNIILQPQGKVLNGILFFFQNECWFDWEFYSDPIEVNEVILCVHRELGRAVAPCYL